MRSYTKDIERRAELRQHYFEDPNYRTWSSLAPQNTRRFAYVRDDILFRYYLNNSCEYLLTGSIIRKLLDKGHELPINWENFYAYFDNRANDEECPCRKSILGKSFGTESVMDILNDYRDKLLKPDYDII